MCTRIRNGVGRQMQPTAGVSAGEGKGKEKPRGKIGKTGPKKIAKTGKYAKIGIAVSGLKQNILHTYTHTYIYSEYIFGLLYI